MEATIITQTEFSKICSPTLLLSSIGKMFNRRDNYQDLGIHILPLSLKNKYSCLEECMTLWITLMQYMYLI